ncbi:MAG: AAA family ATPase [Rubrivivax sp.]|nr:AAA family ATPase [Rubrivivax sp.]
MNDWVHSAVAPVSALDDTEPLRLIGRDDAHQALLSLLMGFDPQAPRGAVVVSESGLGKTALLRVVGASVPGLVSARARVGDKLVPFSTLTRLLQQLHQGMPQAFDEIAWRELGAVMPPALAPAATEPAAAQAKPTGPLRAEAVLRVLRRAAPELVGWMLDDLHLADESSLELLTGVMLNGGPTAQPWVIASQPPASGSVAEGLLEAAAGLDGVPALLLGPLDLAQIFEWITDSPRRLLGAAQSDALALRAHELTGGVPLHLKLLLHPNRQATLDGAHLAQLAEGPSLPSLNALISERLARLRPATLAVARVAAVTGQDFSSDAVMDFTGLNPEELVQSVDEMSALGLWEDDDFAHARIREVARQAIPEAMARSVHAHCATWLEENGGQAARIAAHWQAAGQTLRAVAPLRAAAEQARTLGCLTESMACLSRAAALAEENGLVDVAFDCYALAFESHTEAVRHTDGLSLLAQMQRLAQTPAQQARTLTQRTWHALVHGQLDEAIALGEQAQAQAEPLDDAGLLAAARQYLGTALGVAGQLQRALPLLQAAERWVATDVPPAERASFFSNHAAVLDNLGRADEARALHLRALTLAARHSDASHRATLLANYALSRLEAGDPLGARELGQKAQALIDSGDAEASGAGFVAVVMASAERALGRYALAMDWCDRAEKILAERNPARMAVAHLLRAHVWLDLGQHERALALLDSTGLNLSRALPARHAVRWLLLLARAQARQGQRADAALALARERLPAEGWPELALCVQMDEALQAARPASARSLAEVAMAAQAQKLSAMALSAWLHAALAAADEPGEENLAGQAAEAALALMTQGVEPVHADRALRWLAPACGLAATGETVRARGLLLRGQQWLASTAADQVPPESRQTFLDVHPLNRRLGDTPLPAA